MISNLQVVRAFAALAVVFYHTAFPLFGAPRDFAGVCVFFVLSGFIITYVTREDEDHFLAKRFARVVPPYWAATLLCFLLASFGLLNPVYTIPAVVNLTMHGLQYLGGWALGALSIAFTDQTTLSHLAESLLFVPTSRFPYLSVGWTLNIEMFFYFTFGMMLFISRRWAPLLTSLVIAGVNSIREDCGPICFYWGHDYTRFFIIGIALFYLWRAATPLLAAYPRIVIASSIAYLGWSVLWMASQVATTLWQHYLIPTGMVAAALALHSAGAQTRNRALILLGDASYALYLTHLMVVAVIRTVGETFPAWHPARNVGAMLLTLAASVVFAIGFHLWIERPLVRAFRPRRKSRALPAAQATPVTQG